VVGYLPTIGDIVSEHLCPKALSPDGFSYKNYTGKRPQRVWREGKVSIKHVGQIGDRNM